MVTEDHTEVQPPDDDPAVREIIACAARTLAAPSARVMLGHEWQNLTSPMSTRSSEGTSAC